MCYKAMLHWVFIFLIIGSNSKLTYASPNKKVANDTVTLKYNLSKGESCAFYYVDSFGEADPPFFLTATQGEKKLLISQPTLLIDAFHQIPFLIFPGENYSLTLESTGIPILKANDYQLRNKDLYLFVDYYKRIRPQLHTFLYAPPKNVKVPKTQADYRQLINDAKNDSLRRMDFLTHYNMSTGLSSQMLIYARQLFSNLYTIDILRPLYYRGVNLKNLPANYIQFINQAFLNFNCDSCLQNESYRRASLSLRHFRTRQENIDNGLTLSYIDIIKKSFKGATQRYLLFDALNHDKKQSGIIYNKILKNFITEKNDQFSQQLIRQQQLKVKFDVSAKDAREFVDPNGNASTFAEILAKNKGSIIYLDVWASWCMPCRKNLPYTKKLQEALKSKRIKFLNISIDDNVQEWQKALAAEQLDPTTNWLLRNQSKSDFKKFYAISSIPRYLIIDHTGKVVDDNALSPDHPEILQKLQVQLDQLP